MSRTLIVAAVAAVLLGTTSPAAAAPPPEPLWVGEAGLADAWCCITGGDVALDEFTGDTYVVGTGSEAGSSGDDVLIGSLTKTGALRWQTRYDGPTGGYEFDAQAAFDRRRGMLYVTATSRDQDFNTHIATLAYDRTGRLQWVDRFAGPEGASAVPSDVAVDVRTGTVYVTGSVYVPRSAPTATTLAFDSSGNRLWDRRYAAAERADGTHLAVDSATGGVRVAVQVDVVVGGEVQTAQTVLAYDRSGTLQWSRSGQLPPRFNARTAGIAVGKGGRTVLLTLTSRFGTNGAVGARLATYDPTGRPLWAAAQEGAPGTTGANEQADLAVDPLSGAVYATLAWVAVFEDFEDVDNRMTFAYSTSGRPLWRLDYHDDLANPTSRYGEQAAYLALDPGRGVYAVTRDFFGDNGSTVTRAFTTTGAEQWRAEYRLPGCCISVADPGGVVVDRARGQVVVGAAQPYEGGPTDDGALVAVAYPALGSP